MNFFDQTNSILSDFPLGLRWTGIEAALFAVGYGLVRAAAWCREQPAKAHSALLRFGYRLGEIYVWLAVRISQWYAYRFVEINACQKCPACGIRQKHGIRFDSTTSIDGKPGAMIHDCGNCKASWGEQPLVPLERWLKIHREGETRVRE